MNIANEISSSACDYTLFTLNIDDNIYRCPVTSETLYMLCRDQDCSVDQIDAYLQLKMKVQRVMERRLANGLTEIPALLKPSDFTR